MRMCPKCGNKDVDELWHCNKCGDMFNIRDTKDLLYDCMIYISLCENWDDVNGCWKNCSNVEECSTLAQLEEDRDDLCEVNEDDFL